MGGSKGPPNMESEMFGINLLCCAAAGWLIAGSFGALIGAGTWLVIGVIGMWNGWYD